MPLVHFSFTHASSDRLLLYLNPFFVAVSLDNPMDIDAGYVDVLCSKVPNIHHLLHLQRIKSDELSLHTKNASRPLILKFKKVKHEPIKVIYQKIAPAY